MDAIPDIIVIFAIFFFFLSFNGYFLVLFPAVFRGFVLRSFTPDAIRHLDPALGCLPAGGSPHTFPQNAVG